MRNETVKYVYLIREREFCRLNENVYKIGKSYALNHARLDKYPKWSEVILVMEVENEDRIEKILIDEFTKKFKKENYGNEYFSGDRMELKKEFSRIVIQKDWNSTESTNRHIRNMPNHKNNCSLNSTDNQPCFKIKIKQC